MADHQVNEKNADRSSIEIKSLLRKLHPNNGNHRDRVRALTKFRNYVMGGNKSPEFYDDDIPLLLLGSSAPAAYLDPDDDTLVGLYGLLQACGTPASEAKGGGGRGGAGGGGTHVLKRSARPAMVLVKELLLDWKESATQKKDDPNVICQSFLELPTRYYASSMNLDAHCSSAGDQASRNDARGGAKQEACEIIVLVLTKHLSEDGQSKSPVTLEEVLLQPKAQQEFELWSARHTSASVKETIKKNAAAREAELATLQRQDALASKSEDFMDLEDDTDHADDTERGGGDDDNEGGVADDDDAGYDKDDIVGTMRKRRKDLKQAMKSAVQSGEMAGSVGVATRWEDSLVAREQQARAAALARGKNAAAVAAAGGGHETVRDSQEAMKEEAERNEGKAKVLGKDPLGIVAADDFDLRDVEKSQAEHMEQALHEVQTEMQKAEAAIYATDDLRAKVTSQKESLEALIDKCGGIEALENVENAKFSILPTSPTFDPILFLTLVHRSDNYDTLVGSLDRLSSKTENQVEQLENLVRDNFPLFVRCAEGFDEFRQNSEAEVGLGVNERIDKLEGIAESCAFQAKKSFSPLLDNTREVRKVQSAMAVLQRVAPILQAPAMMRQHLENRRYSEALKTYRRVLVVDESCKIELLLRVKANAQECVREARRDLERRLSKDKVSVDDLLDGIRDLGELLELDVPAMSKKKQNSDNESPEEEGIYDIGGTVVKMRDHPPALACLLLQAAHFSFGVKTMITEADETCQRIFSGEPLAAVQMDNAAQESVASGDGGGSVLSLGGAVDLSDNRASVGAGNQWKYDVLDARVLSTIQAVNMARAWLARLVRVGQAAREDEKRRAARIGSNRRRLSASSGNASDNNLTAFEVFISNVTPSLHKLIEHAAFCALGSTTARREGKEVVMTFGQNVTDKLRTLLRSPLPPAQSTKVGKALADLADILTQNMDGANTLRPEFTETSMFQLSPLEECKTLSDSAVATIEKRRCIYAFDVCARAGANRASGSGKFDADALLNCLQNLADNLSCPEDCAAEVEKGCELVVRRCCEGLASYVRDRGDSARLSAVAECADVVSDRIAGIVDQVSVLLNADANRLEEIMLEDIVGLESAMFDEYLENIRQGVVGTVRIGWLDVEQEQPTGPEELEHATSSSAFPAYLSASLLAIVRCRAQVEQALGEKIRRSENVAYEHLAMATVAEGVVEGICNEVMMRKSQLKVRQADKLANELEFLRNTLKKFLGDDSLRMMESTLRMVGSKAGRGRDYQGDGPDGLAALEELERLGRVYVLCLGE